MASIRNQQVAEMIKRNFGIVLQSEGSYVYGREVMVTVTNVKVSSDFSIASIYLSVFNTENKQAVILMMDAEQKKLRRSLAQRIKSHMRRIPDIQFFLDDTLDEMLKIESIFTRLKDEGQMGEEE